MRTIKPSDTRSPSIADVERVKSLMGKLSPHLTRLESGPLSKPDGMWTEAWSTGPFECSQELYRCDPPAIRYFRLLCLYFPGFSIFHNTDPRDLGLPDFSKLTDAEADHNWLNAALPDDVYNDHLSMTDGLPHNLIYQPPLCCGEAGWVKDGRFISYDQVSYQLRLSLLYFSGLIDYLEKIIAERKKVRILEIGAGYGALAFALKQIFPQADYTIIDLPESLAFSGAYLTLTCPDLPISVGIEPAPNGFRLVPAQMAAQINEEFDLVVNTLSMCEMSTNQVEEYARLIRDVWLVSGGFFFEQNSDNRAVGFNFPELILQNFLERKSAINWSRSRLLHGTPSVWQRFGANPKVSINTNIPAVLQ